MRSPDIRLVTDVSISTETARLIRAVAWRALEGAARSCGDRREELLDTVDTIRRRLLDAGYRIESNELAVKIILAGRKIT